MIDFIAALSSSLPFSEAWKRVCCIGRNHMSDVKPTLIEKARFENHPESDKDVVYTVNLMQCNRCSLKFLENGFEFRSNHD